MSKKGLSLILTPLALAAFVCTLGAFPANPAYAQASGDQDSFAVVPFEYDPLHTFLVSGRWVQGLGLPGDESDPHNKALLLGKGTTTSTNAASGAKLVGLQNNLGLTEIGWDVRDGSHCGAGAPRFNVVTTDGVTHFIGCDSPPPSSTSVPAAGWQRFRYDPSTAFPPISSGQQVSSISIVFDEGTDQGNGFAILDNIDVNGVLVGH